LTIQSPQSDTGNTDTILGLSVPLRIEAAARYMSANVPYHGRSKNKSVSFVSSTLGGVKPSFSNISGKEVSTWVESAFKRSSTAMDYNVFPGRRDL
jgi:hypothetical protein